MKNVTETTKQTKMASAFEIYKAESAKAFDETSSLRQRCMTQFMSKLNQAESTAATYYALCAKRHDTMRATDNQKVLDSTRQRKYTAVRTENASSDVAKKSHFFFNKSEAQRFASVHNYSGVVSGIVQPGEVAQF